MRRGIFILLACFLIVALPSSITALVANVTPFTEQSAQEFGDQFMEGFERFRLFMPQGEDFEIFMEQFRGNFEYGIQYGVQIDALPRPLPYAAGGFLQALGAWISAPLTHLGAWLAYAIWVLLFSKLFGGIGGVKRFLGLTALYAVPNLLGFFHFIPLVGMLVVFIGVIWGWAAYVKGVAVSQQFTIGKAFLVAILPLIIAIVLSLILAILSVMGIVTMSGAGQ